MEAFSSFLYVALLASSLYVNKYVLSVLDFRYPMVFQGWQTLVGFVVFKVMALLGFSSATGVTPMDRAGFISLFPNFVLFVVCIIAGSKAISAFPLVVFICVLNVLPAMTFLIDSSSASSPTSTSTSFKPWGNTALQRVCSLLILVTSVILVWASSPPSSPATATETGQKHLSWSDDGLVFRDTFWLCVHVACGLALSLHTRITDQRFSYSDRLFYSYVFALIVLAPASLYLEEAFEALNFKHRRQLRFILASVFSASVGVAQSLMQSKLKERHTFARVHHLGLLAAALLSVAFFPTDFPWWAWICVTVNLCAVVLLPSHIRPDEKIQADGNWSSLLPVFDNKKQQDLEAAE